MPPLEPPPIIQSFNHPNQKQNKYWCLDEKFYCVGLFIYDKDIVRICFEKENNENIQYIILNVFIIFFLKANANNVFVINKQTHTIELFILY